MKLQRLKISVIANKILQFKMRWKYENTVEYFKFVKMLRT